MSTFVVPHRCNSWFCAKGCYAAKGMRLRKRLVQRVEDFEALVMVTLTVDPTLFESPEHAWRYLRKKRAVSATVQKLKRWGLVKSDRWFCAVEYQGNGMSHFHVLIEARYVEVVHIRKAWDSFRPPEAGPVVPGRPGLGFVQVKGKSNSSKERACNYVTWYLVKTPEHPFPDWVLDYQGRNMRYSTSRGFWGSQPERKEPRPRCAPDCFCTRCRGRKKQRTTREQIALCGSESLLIEQEPALGGLKSRFLRNVKAPFDEVREALGANKEVGRVAVDDEEAKKKLAELEGQEWRWRYSELMKHKAA